MVQQAREALSNRVSAKMLSCVYLRWEGTPVVNQHRTTPSESGFYWPGQVDEICPPLSGLIKKRNAFSTTYHTSNVLCTFMWHCNHLGLPKEQELTFFRLVPTNAHIYSVRAYYTMFSDKLDTSVD